MPLVNGSHQKETVQHGVDQGDVFGRRNHQDLSPEFNVRKSPTQASLDPGHPEEDRLEEQDLLQHEVGSMTLLVVVWHDATRKNAVLLGTF